MKIEKIEEKKLYAIITIDGKVYENFSLEVLYKEKIKAPSELESGRWFAVKEESDKLTARDYLFGKLERTLKSEKEARGKLREKGYFPSAINFAIERAKEYKLIDDENYAKCFVNTYKNSKGINKLRYELKNKGVEESVIDELLDGSGKAEEESALKLAGKFMKAKGEKASKDKLYRHLYGKGYSYDAIKITLERIYKENDDGRYFEY